MCWVLQIPNIEDCDAQPVWRIVASASAPLGPGVTVPDAELAAASEATKAAMAFLAGSLVMDVAARVVWPLPPGCN